MTCCRLTRKHLTVVKRPQCNQPCAVKFFEARENLVKTLRFKTDLLPFNEKYLTVRLPQQSAPVECSEKAGENLVKTSQYRIRLPPALVSHAYPSLGLVTTRKQRAVQQRRQAAGKTARQRRRSVACGAAHSGAARRLKRKCFDFHPTNRRIFAHCVRLLVLKLALKAR